MYLFSPKIKPRVLYKKSKYCLLMKAGCENTSLTSQSHRPHPPLLQTKISDILGGMAIELPRLLLLKDIRTQELRTKFYTEICSVLPFGKGRLSQPMPNAITEQRKLPPIVQICQTFQGCTRNDLIHIHQDHYPDDR